MAVDAALVKTVVAWDGMMGWGGEKLLGRVIHVMLCSDDA
jgi:hypothetical protein